MRFDLQSSESWILRALTHRLPGAQCNLSEQNQYCLFSSHCTRNKLSVPALWFFGGPYCKQKAIFFVFGMTSIAVLVVVTLGGIFHFEIKLLKQGIT